MALSATRVKALKEPGRYSDGEGLHLFINKAGRKSWVHRITIDGRRRDIGLGGYPSVSLARAREKATANRAVVVEGGDPLADRHRSAVPTFKEAAYAVHEANKPRWRNEKHSLNWIQTIERHVIPTLGNMPIDRISGLMCSKFLHRYGPRSLKLPEGCANEHGPSSVGRWLMVSLRLTQLEK